VTACRPSTLSMYTISQSSRMARWAVSEVRAERRSRWGRTSSLISIRSRTLEPSPTTFVIDDTGLFNERLKEWEDFYNFNRPHGALGGQTPYERLREKTRGSV
jgi:transposase InsO family protein